MLRSRRHLPGLIRHRVIVNTRDGQAVEGVLDLVADDCVALVHAHYLREHEGGGTQRIPVAGSAVVPLDNIAFIQDRTAAGDVQVG